MSDLHGPVQLFCTQCKEMFFAPFSETEGSVCRACLENQRDEALKNFDTVTKASAILVEGLKTENASLRPRRRGDERGGEAVSEEDDVWPGFGLSRSFLESEVNELRADRDRLRAENERLKEKAFASEQELGVWREEALKHRMELGANIAEIQRLRKALEWYADNANYVSKGRLGSLLIYSAVLSDEGERARAALDGGKEGK